MKKKKLLFVINPHSGSSDYSNMDNLIISVCQPMNVDLQILHTTGKNDRVNISNKIEEYKPDTVITAGGDGTVNQVASLLINSKIKLGILPKGSANGLAYNVNIGDDFEEEIRKIITGKVHRMDSLLINNKHYCFHLSDIGINARLIKRFEEDDTRGLMGYTKELLNELKDRKKVFKTIIKTKEKKYRLKTEMILLANAKSFGTGAIINPKGEIDDGLFEIIVLKPYPWWSILSLFTKMFTGKINHLKYIKTIRTTSAIIRLNSPQVLQSDGEILGETDEITIKIIPNSLSIIY
nr:diacylglycerol kinase family protein [uncultured Carboxylicivirga sp.]